ncbi:sugar ABC transporter ATP-binding protein [Roseateles chitinivorans]|uniref:Sugar ABC transporter ATP-binding protein n=1 Tax=Roseateles chitinivorans TaxID=2917965 RepID=A0A2G9C6U2_9BURK|nr:sn-glycerol-3-phosphate ABC transporter ATP-binding protein UgpC [Roseateles chitinivorans]PIM52170.1 sugar ABC transporter ATP-binding protein [Roseateles chitinivorans]
MADVQLRGLRKRYSGGVEVLKGIDLDIADGEFTVFVGPSGCGKSTLLRMIAGLEDIDAGDVRIGGRSVAALDASQRGVAMVFQSYALYPHMTVEQNMGFALKMSGLPRAEVRERVGQVAEILQIGPLLQRRPRELSGGQRQRVAIGRAIVRRPEVFLFDEPLSNLDAALRVQMRLELARLHRELGTTMIYVTHDQVEAMTLGDRIALFNAGRVEQVGTPLSLFEQPASRFVAGFLGTPTMNFLTVSATPAGPGEGLSRAGVRVPQAGASARRPTTLGVRANDIALAAPEQGLPAFIEVIEHLGDTVIAHARWAPDQPLIAVRLAPDVPPPRAGDAVGLRIRTERAHFFDAEGHAIAA